MSQANKNLNSKIVKEWILRGLMSLKENQLRKVKIYLFQTKKNIHKNNKT